ncbi:ABC transporter substrate-binding protein [Spongiimicrobium salis]|uniref:ABC transporter substrate-binding protein n=1 Tax=Spongiimicrobium salis TaxID=1667022 RepID=UPI00374D4911
MIDQMGRKVNLLQKPSRIICLNPSQTELLVDLGLEEYIVGVTKFCIHPVHLRKNKTVVGGTKQISLAKIDALKPDIILCNKEENTKEMVLALEKKYPVHVADIATIDETLDLIRQYGVLFQCEDKAIALCTILNNRVADFKQFVSTTSKKRVAYFIWKNPWMAVGNNTFIHHLLELNGFVNIFGTIARYPEIDMNALDQHKPDFLLLSSEPFPFSEKHIEEVKLMPTKAKAVLVDGEYFSWYGSRLIHAFDYFKALHTQLQEI